MIALWSLLKNLFITEIYLVIIYKIQKVHGVLQKKSSQIFPEKNLQIFAMSQSTNDIHVTGLISAVQSLWLEEAGTICIHDVRIQTTLDYLLQWQWYPSYNKWYTGYMDDSFDVTYEYVPLGMVYSVLFVRV